MKPTINIEVKPTLEVKPLNPDLKAKLAELQAFCFRRAGESLVTNHHKALLFDRIARSERFNSAFIKDAMIVARETLEDAMPNARNIGRTAVQNLHCVYSEVIEECERLGL